MYYLMNKDEIYAEFKVQTGYAENIEVLKLYKLPYGVTDLYKFLVQRRPPSNRENILTLLSRVNFRTLEGYLNITHALSLTDTFWVKPVKSKLTWRKVSLYTNSFNEVISHTAFDGGMHGYNLESPSPEYSTDGTFAKCWRRYRGNIELLKTGTSLAVNSGYEPYCEVMATQVLEKLGVPHIKYTIGTKSGRLVSKCNLFTNEKYGFIPASRLYKHNNILEFGVDYKCLKEIQDMLIADTIIFNEDRHLGNFGFMIDNDTQELVSFAPLFDHNLSMLCYIHNETPDDYLRNKGHKLIPNDFITPIKPFITKEWRSRIKQLIDFKFNRAQLKGLQSKRIAITEKAIQDNIRRMLK